MNTRHLIAATTLALTAASGAFAQEATVFPPIQAASSVERAEVRAQAIEALHAGRLSEVAILTQRVSPESVLSRDAVRTATLKALNNGTVERIDAEAYSLV